MNTNNVAKLLYFQAIRLFLFNTQFKHYYSVNTIMIAIEHEKSLTLKLAVSLHYMVTFTHHCYKYSLDLIVSFKPMNLVFLNDNFQHFNKKFYLS